MLLCESVFNNLIALTDSAAPQITIKKEESATPLAYSAVITEDYLELRPILAFDYGATTVWKLLLRLSKTPPIKLQWLALPPLASAQKRQQQA